MLSKFEHLFNLFISLPNDFWFCLLVLSINLSIFIKQTMFLTGSYTAFTTGARTSNTPASDPQGRKDAQHLFIFSSQSTCSYTSAQIASHNEMQLALGGKALQADSVPKGRGTPQNNKGDCAVTFHQEVMLCPQPPQTRHTHMSSFCSQKPGSKCHSRAEKVSCIFSSVQES